ncbi:hypothetical protein QL285_058855 [Trifolium repens]|nr:hypothetical protein QL285_058855 [Trifolium repens]
MCQHIRRKLDDRSQAIIFLDYDSTEAYKLNSPTRNKMVTCRDVKFDKAKSWNWSGNVVHQDVATSGVAFVPKEAMLVEAEPIDLDQAMNDSNWLEATKKKKYAEDILKRFKMVGCNASVTPTDTMPKLEAEYVAGSLAACQANWLQSLLSEMSIIEDITVVLKIDNKSAINLAKNPVRHGKSKHIETRFHFLRDQVTKGRLKLEYCSTDNQQADILIKAVKRANFSSSREMRVVSFDILN